MKISARTAESIEHYFDVDIYQFIREINGKSFLFTIVGMPEGIVYKVSEKVNGVIVDRHNIKVARNVK